MLEENFNNIKKERKEEKEKSEGKNELGNRINAKNISINELIYHSINNNGKNNHNSIARLTKQKMNKSLS